MATADDQARLKLIDSTGRAVLSFGRTGSGPGEFRSPSPLVVGRDSVMIWDAAQLRVTTWSTHGPLIDSWQSSFQIVPLAVYGPDIVALQPDAGHLRLVRVGKSKSPTPLLNASDSFFVNHFSESAKGAVPVFGTLPNGFVVGEGMAYRLGLYHANSDIYGVLRRELPPQFPGGHLKLPHLWPGQTPPPGEGGTRVPGCYPVAGRVATRAAASFRRQLLPSNFSRCPWWSRRSSKGVTTTVSPSRRAQSSTGRLLVTIVDARS